MASRSNKSIGRGSLEKSVIKDLRERHANFEYEPLKVPFSLQRFYVPDFVLGNCIIVETKGWWNSEDRRKIKAVVQQHPDLDIRMVFGNSANKIAKGSPTTYADYCKRLGIPYADKLIPFTWLIEPHDTKRCYALDEFRKG